MFLLRLLLSFAFVLLLVGAVGYLLIDRELRRSQIATYAAEQRADAATFEAKDLETLTEKAWIREVSEVLDATRRRAGTLETLLIDQRSVIVASGDGAHVGTRDSDPRIEAALADNKSYAGHEADPNLDGRDFEFVTPVNLVGGRYVYETTYDHLALDTQLSHIRQMLLLIGLLALTLGLVVFYLVGGRGLIRSHRVALQRATRDGLTDLPNQRAFHDELPHAIANADRHQEPLALAVLDIDDFKFVNDKHGHPEGDARLRRVAEVLQGGRTGDRVYRIGGDEFALLMPHTDAAGSRVLARRLHRTMSEAGVPISVGTSGLRPGQSSDTLLAEADAALYEAKRQGGNQTAHFEDVRDTVTLITLDKKSAVRRLIEEGNLTTVFQPIWDIAAGTLLGLEALTRPDPSYQLTGPLEAFDLAAQIGRVHELDIICATEALSHAGDLPPDALLFLNLCPQTLDLDANGNDWLNESVQQAGLTPDRVVVEVTERFGGRTASIVKCLQRLRKQGFKIALDDVGTGNSGLEMLRQVQAEYVKIDGSIVSAAVTDPSARAVLMAMATFARQTGAYVIAEGIEDEETLDFLRHIDDLQLHTDNTIQGGQGFGLGTPQADPNTTPLKPSLPIPHTQAA